MEALDAMVDAGAIEGLLASHAIRRVFIEQHDNGYAVVGYTSQVMHSAHNVHGRLMLTVDDVGSIEDALNGGFIPTPNHVRLMLGAGYFPFNDGGEWIMLPCDFRRMNDGDTYAILIPCAECYRSNISDQRIHLISGWDREVRPIMRTFERARR